MISLSKCNRLLDAGFSLITVGENKQPNYSWKSAQTKALTKEQFQKQYEYSGGYIKKDGTEMQATKNAGLVTGYDFLECIDIDLKVFSTSKEQYDFWDEFLQFVKDNIYDFDEKFVVAKTKNAGYHILYKSKRVQGNTKIAKLKGHKEAIIESRGIGGYVFLYENFVGSKTYADVQFISDNDRDILWNICQSYNHVEKEVEIPVKRDKKLSANGLTAWDDFDNRTNLYDLISDEFDVVRQVNDRTIIKRKGSDNVSSGSIFHSNGCMYLFTTGSTYPSEKLISPFVAYTYKHHGGDFSASAKELYQKGYGDRIVNEVPEIGKIEIENIEFPIDIFPESIQKYILSSAQSLNLSVDFMGASLLFLTSTIIGNSFEIEVKHGWRETASIWLALVGNTGVGKTPSINAITFPLEKLNAIEIKKYVEEYKRYEAFINLSDQDKKINEEIKRPKKTQFIVNDFTLEALVELHDENKNGVAVIKDELAGWMKDMNKYRAGSDLEHWLSSWSGKSINLNRKTAKSSFVDRAFIPVLGGIQPDILDQFDTVENKASGFLDRMLFLYPDIEIDNFSEKEMKQDFIDWYENYIVNFYREIHKIIKTDIKGNIEPHLAVFKKDAKNEYIRIFNELTEMQNSENESEYLKSMLPKQKSYVARFSLLLNALHSHDVYSEKVDIDLIEIKSVLGAEKLSKYFIEMARKIKVNSMETSKIKKTIRQNDKSNDYDLFLAIYEKDKNVNRSKLANILNVSRRTIQNYIKHYENKTLKL